MKMNMTSSSTYQKTQFVIDPFILHFLSSSIEPPPPLPSCMFFYDPTLVVPPPPSPPRTPSQPPPPANCSSKLANRHRYSPIQLYTLHRVFQQLPYPTSEQRRIIAKHLSIDVEQVRIWFSNRRSRQRHNSQPIHLIEPTTSEFCQSKELFSHLHLVFSS